MNWKAPAGCVATAAALAAVAGVLSSDHVFQPAVKPLLLAALGLIAVAVLIPASGVLMLVWAVLRGFGRPRRKLPPAPGWSVFGGVTFTGDNQGFEVQAHPPQATAQAHPPTVSVGPTIPP